MESGAPTQVDAELQNMRVVLTTTYQEVSELRNMVRVLNNYVMNLHKRVESLEKDRATILIKP